MISEEKIIENWDKFKTLILAIDKGAGLRRQTLSVWYDKHEERIAMMPASGNDKYHNAFPGGYIDHVLGVHHNAITLYHVWRTQGAYLGDFTLEELSFCALNHDLGKFGTETEEYYIPQTSQWHRDNKGELYMHNPKVPFMKTSDRSLHILQSLGIPLSENEYLGIKLHDGLYEESNKSYLVSYSDTYRLQSSLAYILHQADLMASRIEYDNENRKSHKNETITFKINPENMSKTTLNSSEKSVYEPQVVPKKKAQGKYAHLLNHK